MSDEIPGLLQLALGLMALPGIYAMWRVLRAPGPGRDHQDSGSRSRRALSSLGIANLSLGFANQTLGQKIWIGFLVLCGLLGAVAGVYLAIEARNGV